MNTLAQTFLKNGGIACDVSIIKEAQNILLFGGFVEGFKRILENMESKNNVFLLSPLRFNPYNFTQFVYEVGAEEAVVALLAYGFSASDVGIKEVEGLKDKALQEFVKTLDVGYLSSECNFAEEELQEIVKGYVERGLVLVVGEDLATHKNASNIAKILALLSVRDLKIVFLDSKVNAVSLEREEIKPLGDLKSYDGLVVYVPKESKKGNILEVSKQFCNVSKMQDGAKVKVKLESHQEILAQMQCNAILKGMVGILWISREVLQKNFCYQLVSLSKVA
ncbi:hypothetical protein [Helicobacter sp.]|uniref:hypothetical protein n=1 Tax=Helicobacter sp. TaxID=218 RepID=UPI0025BFB10F|nr:hypothetical protein [Helicobacter sp.]MCI5968011.1 hypothetical protein [Helicobacter sp.]MDY2584662.1 hypothetical protein [Helicobacter sp.]